jgi:hypothetical protein
MHRTKISKKFSDEDIQLARLLDNFRGLDFGLKYHF